MTFDQWVTVIALGIGPVGILAGIFFGWWLSQRSDEKRDQRTAADQRGREQATRVVAIVDTAQRIVSDMTSLIHAEIMTHNQRPVDVEQFREVVRALNTTRSRLGLLAAEAAVFGPSWASEAVNKIHEGQNEAALLLESIQRQLNDADVDAALERIAAVEADIDRLVVEAQGAYAAGAGT